MEHKIIPADEALKQLIEGNKKYLQAKDNNSDISLNTRIKLFNEGQHPFAVIFTCSDSRVIPESIFMQGLGSIFVIRVAGNVVGSIELGSLEYAIDHLNCKLIMVLGHTNCGAIAESMFGSHGGYVANIIEEIKTGIGSTKDTLAATKLNVQHSITKMQKSEILVNHMKKDLKIVGALYHTDSGIVEIL